jgi:hypothetical protein
MTSSPRHKKICAAVGEWIAKLEDEEESSPGLRPRKLHKTEAISTEDAAAMTKLTTMEAVTIALAASAYIVNKRFADDGIEDALSRAYAFAVKVVAKAEALKQEEEEPFDANVIAHRFNALA